MIKIDTSNYEAYFLDYLEGQLSKTEEETLMRFLEQHPELKTELEEFEFISLNQESFKLDESEKAGLLKEEKTGLNRLDYLLIAELEHELSNEEKKELALLNRSITGLDKEKKAFAKTIISPPIVQLANKTQLKKRGIVIPMFRNVAAVAAVLLGVLLWSNYFAPQERYAPNMADVSSIQQIQSPKLDWSNFNIKENILPELDQKNIQVKVNSVFAENSPQKQNETDQKEPKPTKGNDNYEEVLEDKAFDLAQNGDLNVNDEKSPAQENNNIQNETTDPVEPQQKEASKDYLTVKDYAKTRVKKDILNNKTLSEALADEIAKATNDKISFEQVKNKKGRLEKFALNIGKLSISKNN